MVLGKLGESLRSALRKIARAGYVSDEVLSETTRDLQRALLSADVNVKLVSELSKKIKDRAKNEKPKKGLSPREHIVNVIYEELLAVLGGGEKTEISLKEKTTTKILLLGLFGSGKTTTVAKLGRYFKNRGMKTLLISTDTWRPAAFEQLKQLGGRADITVVGGLKDPIKSLKEGLKDEKKYDIIIVDSAGRDTLNKELTKEIKKINKILKPNETILVVPADLGQKAAEQAQHFKDAVGVNGVILTKLDSTAKGGGALSACSQLGVPIKFVGLGEGLEDLEEFNPTKFLSRLLGMGDLEALAKKTQEIFKDAEPDQMKAMVSGKLTLKDFYAQIQSMKKMGSLSKIMEMLPMGVSIPKDQLQLSQEKIDGFTHLMDSMTPEELSNPDLLDGSRVKRIAVGAGSSVQEVRSLLKQYNMTKKMMKRFGKNKGSMQRLMGKLKGFGF